MIDKRLSGFKDKLFWRPVEGGDWHCFKKLCSADGGGYMSLCNDHERPRSGGQSCCRPPSPLRCARCDGLEMQRRGWDEGGLESENWRDARP